MGNCMNKIFKTSLLALTTILILTSCAGEKRLAKEQEFYDRCKALSVEQIDKLVAKAKVYFEQKYGAMNITGNSSKEKCDSVTKYVNNKGKDLGISEDDMNSTYAWLLNALNQNL